MIASQKLHGYGHVILEKAIGSDLSIANSARVSLDNENPEMDERSERLVRRLLIDRHGTPFEDVMLYFDIKAPISVIREFQRHRIASYSEKSLRYVEADAEFYLPDAQHVREAVTDRSLDYNYRPIEDQQVVRAVQTIMDNAYNEAMGCYRELLDHGVAKELARNVLPVGIFTRTKVRINLRSLMNFLSLRNAPQAMEEIRDIAEIMEEFAFTVAPVAMAAFVENGRTAP